MENYVAILRGINVGGQKSVKMDELRLLFEQNACEDVKTYIQSGNVIFNHEETDQGILSDRIGKAIFQKFAFRVPIIIRAAHELEIILRSNPFLNEKKSDTTKLHVTFLDKPPDRKYADLLENMDYAPDLYHLSGREIYLFTPNGYGKIKLSNTFFENKLKVIATTRNWTTVETIYSMMGNPVKN
jgi:uncharacterized protein (DUF1697 family)